MMLLFTALDQFGREKKYSWWFESLEYALDTLSSLAAKGRTILTAEFVDGGHRVTLPVEAFDGTCFSAPVKDLEDQWQRLLKKPARALGMEFVDVNTRPLV